MPDRVSWDRYFIEVARTISKRGTCDRLKVGAVIVRDKMVVSCGYNGSIRGLEHCDDVGHMMEDGHCVRVVHAEANAIVQAARNGIRTQGCVMYVTYNPCWPCFKLIAGAGIKRICYGELYRDNQSFDFAKEAGVDLSNLVFEERL